MLKNDTSELDIYPVAQYSNNNNAAIPTHSHSHSSTSLNVISIVQRLKRNTPELTQVKESELVDAIQLKTTQALHARQKLLVCLFGKLSKEAGILLTELMDTRRKERVNTKKKDRNLYDQGVFKYLSTGHLVSLFRNWKSRKTLQNQTKLSVRNRLIKCLKIWWRNWLSR